MNGVWDGNSPADDIVPPPTIVVMSGPSLFRNRGLRDLDWQLAAGGRLIVFNLCVLVDGNLWCSLQLCMLNSLHFYILLLSRTNIFVCKFGV
ncbi:hypothetical protein CEXT_347671 [Caerostris extrusa]|uniref:Uncharacterized protein n=1 Tax=Caerostris extrusa TaxID=172846 RepID=A0AAV4SHS3_CAEEX|nr:hypothetical protein CEXT_347671 [Caerostris extrusa]